jgi:hypothetical protein
MSMSDPNQERQVQEVLEKMARGESTGGNEIFLDPVTHELEVRKRRPGNPGSDQLIQITPEDATVF